METKLTLEHIAPFLPYGLKALINNNMQSDERWILFKDKQPKNGDHVIFGTNHISDEKDRLCKPTVMAGWYMDGFYSYLTKQKLTAKYWMPMPILCN